MKKIIFAYWLIYEHFYKIRKGYPANLIKTFRGGFTMLKKHAGWYERAREIHQQQKADK